jgi:A/G-specific adenine glycosylase
MVDESSGRLLRRLLGLTHNGPAYADRQLLDVAGSLVPEDHPWEFNLGLLDIAAAVCRPKNPACSLCPLAEICELCPLKWCRFRR